MQPPMLVKCTLLRLFCAAVAGKAALSLLPCAPGPLPSYMAEPGARGAGIAAACSRPQLGGGDEDGSGGERRRPGA